MSEIEKQEPQEVQFEEAKAQGVPDLKELLDKKAQEKLNMDAVPGLHVLKKSVFYMNGDELREHVATYKDYAIMLKQEHLKENIQDNLKEITVFPALIQKDLLHTMKRVNGNVIRKMKPKTLHKYEIMALVQQTIGKIDKGI
jgi:hypothetical protein